MKQGDYFIWLVGCAVYFGVWSITEKMLATACVGWAAVLYMLWLDLRLK